MSPIKCDQCTKIIRTKLYHWKYKEDEGDVYLCKECMENLKSNGYTLTEE